MTPRLPMEADMAETERSGELREAAAAYMAHVNLLACDHGSVGGTHTGCPEALVLRAALATPPDTDPIPSLAELRQMSPSEVNRFLASRGVSVRVRDDAPDTDPSGLDFVAQAERIRSEHEATHGEAEMCGAECIVLGLATFDDEDTDPSDHPVERRGDLLVCTSCGAVSREPDTDPSDVLQSAYRIALRQIEHDGEVINRLKQALHVAAHKPHDRDGAPDTESGFPTCSVCAAILTDPSGPDARWYVCPDCDGDGWNPSHDPEKPMQVQCERCVGSGRLAIYESLAIPPDTDPSGLDVEAAWEALERDKSIEFANLRRAAFAHHRPIIEVAIRRESAADRYHLAHLLDTANAELAAIQESRAGDVEAVAIDPAGLDVNEAALIEGMARQMVKELRANHHKRPWTDLSPEYLLSELRGHVDKLAEDGTWEHAADVGNLAAMLVTRWQAAIQESRAGGGLTEGGTTTECPIEGVHEHAFRGPHRFHEWEPGS